MSSSPLEVWDRIARVNAAGLRVVSDNDKPLAIQPASLRDGAAIPPRGWLYGTMLVRRYVTVLVAPGGVGKTAWSLAAGLSVAHGRGLIGDWVHVRTNALFCCLEDPEDEFDRRIAACMIRHGLDAEDLHSRVYHINGRDRRLVLAALDADGLSVCYPDKEALVEQVRRLKIGLIVVDPWVNSHELEENSNPQVNAAARAWAEVAELTGCAVLLIHHTRKGATAGDIDAARGASALVGAARAGFTLTSMAPEEASEFGVPEAERRLYIRLDDAKANLAPASAKARWYRLDSVELGNGTKEYPRGDSVQAVVEWHPPELWKQLTPSDCNAALDAIAEGPGPGRRYTHSRSGQGGGSRWAGRILVRDYGLTEEQASKVIATWVRNGVLEVGEYTDPQTRKTVSGLIVNDARRPS